MNFFYRFILNEKIVYNRKKMNDLVFVMCNLKMNDKDKRQVIDFDEVLDNLPSGDE